VNAVDLELVRSWQAALTRLEAAGDARALVVTGAGPCFSAGLDLKAVPRYSRAQQAEMITCINRALTCLYGLPMPTIAAINGHAIAAGLVVALACDYRIASRAPYELGLAEGRAGIPFPAVAMTVVRAELTAPAARRLTLLARNYGPEDALADAVVDELQAPEALRGRAATLAAALASIPGPTYARIKQQLRATALAECRRFVATGADPMLESWLGKETETAAAALLRERRR
jgi:enoyl-CoA hydratase